MKRIYLNNAKFCSDYDVMYLTFHKSTNKNKAGYRTCQEIMKRIYLNNAKFCSDYDVI